MNCEKLIGEEIVLKKNLRKVGRKRFISGRKQEKEQKKESKAEKGSHRNPRLKERNDVGVEGREEENKGKDIAVFHSAYIRLKLYCAPSQSL